VVTEEQIDENDVVVSDSFPMRYHWFEVPAEVVAAKGTIRLLTDDERRRLMLGEVDEREV
jgi:hypothetical protein